jgi:uncharacterized SAM-binding protein YcdF (DUF218 family)
VVTTRIPQPQRRRTAGRRSTKRPHRRAGGARRRPVSWQAKVALSGAGLIVVLVAWAAVARAVAPKSNTKLTRFDAIIVLGSPADGDGNPSPHQLARVTEAVREYERGVAPRLIVTGGAAHNRFVEAEVMARTAHAEGIPEAAIVEEPRAKDTIENACYSAEIMKEHGWRSAEVVSSASHLPRAGMIFSHLPVEWRTHAAPPLGPEDGDTVAAMVEVLKTARYLFWARWVERCGT